MPVRGARAVRPRRPRRDYADADVAIVAISSNDADEYPADRPESLAEEAAEAGYTFPYLYDETQEIAKAYTAACTPDFFLFDADRRLVYRGQLDDSRPGNDVPVTGTDLRAALDAVLTDRPIGQDQRPSIGCSKARAGLNAAERQRPRSDASEGRSAASAESHASNAARAPGHSSSVIENQAESRVMSSRSCASNTPSNVKPSRRAAARSVRSASHFHSTRR